MLTHAFLALPLELVCPVWVILERLMQVAVESPTAGVPWPCLLFQTPPLKPPSLSRS